MTIDEALDAAFGPRIAIPIAEVAELIGPPARGLLADCRAGRITHLERKGARYMTRDQVEEFIAAHTRAGSGQAGTVSQDAADLDEARKFNARRSRRLSKPA